MTQTTDYELEKRTQGGDKEAFAELYRRYQGSVYGFALQMTGVRELAEDVTQEVFMVLIRRTALYDENRGSLRAFLLGVTKNHVLRRLKQERPFVSIESAADEPAILGHSEIDLVIHHQSMREMCRAILSLPSHYREVVVLCELQELSYAEAAEALGCAIGTVRSRLHRARIMLTEKLSSSREDRATVKEIESERCFA
ncbi:MAG TPA: sigma-70 family RNA polymerase sigma factor [Pyrinomonadaceae bacterium]|nr:sigma-70 family RNA polymerase sigma factor [Pyrinomonadaceae bacterium]